MGSRLADALVEQALGGLAGHDGGALGAGFQRRFPAVEAQAGLPRRAVGAVALEAIVGKDGADLALEIDRRRGLRQQKARHAECQRPARGPQARGAIPVIGQATLLRSITVYREWGRYASGA